MKTRRKTACPFDKYKLKPKGGHHESSNPFLSKTISHTINAKGDQVAFITMPISHLSIKKKIKPNTEIEIQEAYLRNHPYIQLKRVILGPRLINSKQIHPVVEFILNVANDKIGERIEIVESNFKDIYKND